jgi:hypothetical protein
MDQSTHLFDSITGIITIDVDDVVRLLAFAGPCGIECQRHEDVQ